MLGHQLREALWIGLLLNSGVVAVVPAEPIALDEELQIQPIEAGVFMASSSVPACVQLFDRPMLAM